MKMLFLGIFLANLLLALAGYFILPDTIASHFGSGGYPNGWSSKTFFIGLMITVVYLPMFLLVFFSEKLITSTPKKWLNLPYKDYWLKEENIPLLLEKWRAVMFEFGVALFSFHFITLGFVIEANMQPDPRLNEGLFFPVFIAFMVYIAIWLYRLIKTFKPPQHVV
ncbi:MAG: DUF1648 domain-containing protein [Pseudomonadales bacterium]|nr:DUF1648 domain-containing protein [Pseudomonadales bacterium]